MQSTKSWIFRTDRWSKSVKTAIVLASTFVALAGCYTYSDGDSTSPPPGAEEAQQNLPADLPAALHEYYEVSNYEQGVVRAPVFSTPYDAAYSPNGRYIAVTAAGSRGRGAVHLVDRETGLILQTFYGADAFPSTVGFSYDGTELYSMYENNWVVRWNVETGEFIGADRYQNSVVSFVHVNSERALLGLSDGEVSLISTNDWASIDSKPIGDGSNPVTDLVLVPGTDTVLAGMGTDVVELRYDDSTNSFWDTGTIYRHDESIESIDISGDGRFAAIGHSVWNARNLVTVWNLLDQRRIQEFEGERYGIDSPGGRTTAGFVGDTYRLTVFASRFGNGSWSGSRISRYDIESGVLSDQVHYEYPRELTGRFSPSGDEIYTLPFWNRGAGGRQIATDDLSAVYDSSSRSGGAVGFSESLVLPNDTGLVTAGSDVFLWDQVTGALRRAFTGHEGGVQSVDATADGSVLASVGVADATIRLWNTWSGEELRRFDIETDLEGTIEPHLVRVSSDGTLVLVYGWVTSPSKAPSAFLIVYDTKTGSILWDEQRDPYAGADFMRYADFVPGSLSIAYASNYERNTQRGEELAGEIIFVDGRTGHRQRVLRPDDSDNLGGYSIHYFEFTLDGRTLVAYVDDVISSRLGMPDRVVRAYDVASGSERRLPAPGKDLIGNILGISPDGRRFVSGVQSWGQDQLGGPIDAVYVCELDTGVTVSVLDNTPGIRGAVFSANGQYVAIHGAGGVTDWYDVSTGEKLYSSLARDDGEWLSWTPEGHFTGSDALIEDGVYFVRGTTVFPIDRFFEHFYRPDIIEARIAGNESAIGATGTIAELLVPLPEVEIAFLHQDNIFRPFQADVSQDLIVDEGVVTVRVTARDTGGGVENLRLFHNGSRISGETRGLVREGSSEDTLSEDIVQTILTIRLLDGDNRISAVAFSQTGVEGNAANAFLSYRAPEPERPILWLVAVGANDYENPTYNLNYAVGDARGFAAAIERAGRGLFQQVESTVLLDRDVTRNRLIAALNSVSERSRAEDVFVFFYAGHGIALQSQNSDEVDFYFVPHDVVQMTDLVQLSERGISGPEFEDLVTAIPARKQLHIIDACNAGAINSAFGVRGAGEEIALSRMSRATGSALIAASRDDQFAQEFPALGQGALTRAVLDGLSGDASGDDNEITVGELKSYVESAVPRLTEEYTGRPQFPTGFTFGQDFPVGIR